MMRLKKVGYVPCLQVIKLELTLRTKLNSVVCFANYLIYTYLCGRKEGRIEKSYNQNH